MAAALPVISLSDSYVAESLILQTLHSIVQHTLIFHFDDSENEDINRIHLIFTIHKCFLFTRLREEGSL